jgi:Flp pilus assembly protein TadG
MRVRRHCGGVRRAVSAVESAIVYPLTFLLILGLVIVAQGVARYQEVAALARSASRYASTHGAQFRKDNGQPVGSAGTPVAPPGSTPVTINGLFWYQTDPTQPAGSDSSWAGTTYDSAARPKLVALDPTLLTFQVGYPPVVNQSSKPDNWPGSQVTVTVTYQWLPPLYLLGPFTLSSTSSLPITN